MQDPPGDLVELTRRAMIDTNDGDFDAAMAAFAPHAVFDVSEAGLGRFEGREAVRAYLEDWMAAYERQEYTSWEGTDLGAGVVLVVAELQARLAGSDASVHERWAFRLRWEAGAIVEVLASQDIAGSLAAAQALAASMAGAKR